MRKIIFIGQSGDKAVYYNTRTREALVANKSVLLNTEGARKTNKAIIPLMLLFALFGGGVGLAIFSFTSPFRLNERMIQIISLAIFTSVVLVFVDTFLRVLVEARNFNLATNRELTIKNMFLAIIWRGWASVEVNGKQRRFLVSGKLRADMIKKLVKSYPWLFLLSFILLTLPDVDIPMLGRIDVFLSTLLY